MTTAAPETRVVVTGLGAVSAWGWSCEALARGLDSGRAAIREPRRLSTEGQRTHLAAEVSPPPPEVVEALSRELEDPGVTRADAFALAAAREAWLQAGLGPWKLAADAPARAEVGVFFGGSTAGMAEGEGFFARLLDPEQGRPRLASLLSHQLNGPGDAVARRLRLAGPVESFSSACAAGALAVQSALEALRRGRVEVAVVGGADGLCALTYSGFNSLRAVDERACRPFRGDRAGLSLGEGAGVLILEREDHARARGATVLAELLGAGASCDAHHMTAPHPEGRGAAAALAAALEDAAADPAEISFVNAHGTGTPLNDGAEWRALTEVFGPRAEEIPVTSTKGSVGHLLGASGALEAVAAVLDLHDSQVHPTPGDGEVDPSLEVDLVRGAPRDLESSPDRRRTAVSTSLAFGGANAALVLASAPSGAAAPENGPA